MTAPRILAAALLALVALAPPAVAAPLAFADLLHLSDNGVGEPVLLSIAESQGIAGPLSAQDVLAMKEAGWSESLMSAVIRSAAAVAAGEAPTTRVVYGERDGAVVAFARGEAEPHEPPPQDAPEPAPAAPAAAPAPVVVVQAPAPVETAAPAETSPEGIAFPVGAVHGWTGSTVFLPARFGGSTPSAFGRTIVNTGAPATGTYAPYYGQTPGWSVHPSVLPTRVAPQDTTLIRTSRGTRRIPN